MALGDYEKIVYVNGGPPGISAARLNNHENKTEELDTAQAAHLAEKATYQAATGSNAISITTGGDFGLTQGNWIKWIQTTTNTGAVTLNVDSKGAKAIKNPDGTALSAGELEAGYPYEAFYSLGDGFFIFRPSGGLEILGQDIISGVLQGTVDKFDAVYATKLFDASKLANPSVLPTGSGIGVAFSTDGVYMSVVHYATPYVTIYKRSGDIFTKLANPSDLPASAGRGVAFSSDGVYMLVAYQTTPYVTIYKDVSIPDIYKSQSIADLTGVYGAGYVMQAGVATDTVDMVRIFKQGG